MGIMTNNLELSEDVSAATALTGAIIWTTGDPTLSYTPTIADGAAPTSTEIGVALKKLDTQVVALVADVAAIRSNINT